MTAETPDGDEMGRRGRVGGYAAAAKLTPEERTAKARKAVQARWEREAKRRAAAGEAPLKKTRSLLTDEEKAYYVAKVDDAFGVNYPWRHPSDRIRQAEKLARAEAARAAAEAFRRAKIERGDA